MISTKFQSENNSSHRLNSIESIPWVRCASGNVWHFGPDPDQVLLTILVPLTVSCFLASGLLKGETLGESLSLFSALLVGVVVTSLGSLSLGVMAALAASSLSVNARFSSMRPTSLAFSSYFHPDRCLVTWKSRVRFGFQRAKRMKNNQHQKEESFGCLPVEVENHRQSLWTVSLASS